MLDTPRRSAEKGGLVEPPLFLTRQEMEPHLLDLLLYDAIAAGFVAFSEGRAIVPPPGELQFTKPRGDVQIKFGAIEGGPNYVVKVASSFYDNPEHGLASSQGVMLAFRRDTGVLQAVLLDDGLLTDVRTAIAGALAARQLAHRTLRAIGIVGTGIQARLQLRYLAPVTPCRRVFVWGRRPSRAHEYKNEMVGEGFDVTVAHSVDELGAACDLIVTTTPSDRPLLLREHVRPGTHITAVGADTPEKQELDPLIVEEADLVVADSVQHCTTRGEISHVLRRGRLRLESVVELGDVLSGRAPGRRSAEAITVADLTGLAVQDLQIATFMIERLGPAARRTSASSLSRLEVRGSSRPPPKS
jgi:ornithine cyclodeaminase